MRNIEPRFGAGFSAVFVWECNPVRSAGVPLKERKAMQEHMATMHKDMTDQLTMMGSMGGMRGGMMPQYEYHGHHGPDEYGWWNEFVR